MSNVRMNHPIFSVATAMEKDGVQAISQQEEKSGLAAARETLAASIGETEALQSTFQGLSLNLGSRFQSQMSAEAARKKRLRKALTHLVKQQLSTGQLNHLLSPFETVLSEKQPLSEILMVEGLGDGGKVIVIEGLLAKKSLNPEQAQSAQSLLDELTQKEDFLLESFAFLNLGAVDPQSLKEVKLLYQGALEIQTEQGEGLAHWFSMIAQWPQRQEKIQCVFQTLGLELANKPSGPDLLRLSAVMNDLSKMCLFLTIQDQASHLARGFSMNPDTILLETLNLLDQHWVYPEWISDRAAALGLTDEEKRVYLQGWKEVIELLPTACFRDEQQMQQILQAITELQTPITESEIQSNLFTS